MQQIASSLHGGLKTEIALKFSLFSALIFIDQFFVIDAEASR